jgi:undecaprenyl pyrophosphate phosphatase UppP
MFSPNTGESLQDYPLATWPAQNLTRTFNCTLHALHISGTADLASAVFPSVVGAVLAFFAGLLALRWLSRWLEGGRWYLFGIYCLAAATVVAGLHHVGY